MVSGIYFGAALLSTGRVLSWGSNGSAAGALGRTCGDPSAKPEPDYCNRNNYAGARNPGYVEQVPRFQSIESGFTAIRGLTPDGELWGWSAKELAYCLNYTCDYAGIRKFPPVKIATNVISARMGQGYVIWETDEHRYFAQGYNPAGALGHTAYNGSVILKLDIVREMIFFPTNCWSRSKSAIETAIKNENTRPFTLDECLKGLCVVANEKFRKGCP